MVTRYSLEVKRSGRTTEGPSDVRDDRRLAHIPPEVTSLQYIMLYCIMGPLLVSGSCHISLAVLKVRRTALTKLWSTCRGAAGRGGEGRGGGGEEREGEGRGRGGEGRGEGREGRRGEGERKRGKEREEGRGRGREGRRGKRGGVKCSTGSNHVLTFSHKKTTSKHMFS